MSATERMTLGEVFSADLLSDDETELRPKRLPTFGGSLLACELYGMLGVMLVKAEQQKESPLFFEAAAREWYAHARQMEKKTGEPYELFEAQQESRELRELDANASEAALRDVFEKLVERLRAKRKRGADAQGPE